MTVLPRPIPHPLDHCPFEVPPWAYDALEWVVGFDWPEGDEIATWDVADRWYQLTDALSGPHEDAFAAARRIVAGYAADRVPADGFTDAWQRLAGDAGAPLNVLLQITRELGEFVEEAGRELEAAKLAAWIELGEFLTELTALALADSLHRGVAAPAAGRLIATRGLAIRKIFQGLLERLETATPHGRGVEVEGRAAPTVGQESTRVIRPPRPASVADGSGRDGGRPAGAVEPGSMTRRLYPTQPRLGRPGEAPSGQVGAMRGTVPRPRASGSEGPRAAGSQPPRAAGAEQQRPVGSQPAAVSGAETPRPASGPPPGRTARIDLPRNPVPATGPAVEEDEDTVPLSPPPRRETSGEVTRRISPAEVARAVEARQLFDVNQREEFLDHLAAVVADAAAKIAAHGARSDLITLVVETEAQVEQTRSAQPAAAVDPPRWARTAVDPERSTPPPYGGLRRPHQPGLADAPPQALADPRSGTWFARLNGDGPADDPTRALNSVDAVLALFETYRLGRPRVAAPRTFDNYAHGDVDRPVGGEWGGLDRVRQVTGADFQNLCPYVGGADHALARPAVEAALRNLTNHLHNSGHGAFAVIVTDLEDGGCHAWAAVNHNGTVLFLDPQAGRIAVDTPLYRHHGVPSASNVVSMDALVVDGRGAPAPLPFHGPGQWAATS